MLRPPKRRAVRHGDALIHVGNCLELLATLADGSVDHVITDPPYSANVHANQQRIARGARRKATGKSFKKPLTFDAITPELMLEVSCEIARVTKRWALVFCNVELVSTWMLYLKAGGLEYARTALWIIPDCAPQITGDRPAPAGEAIVCVHAKGRKRWNAGGKRGIYTHGKARGEDERLHETPKPVGLLLELVDDFTDPGETVLDPFAGGGTTGAACIRRGRHFLGAELDPKRAATAIERLEAEKEGISISRRRAKQAPLFPFPVLTEADDSRPLIEG